MSNNYWKTNNTCEFQLVQLVKKNSSNKKFEVRISLIQKINWR